MPTWWLEEDVFSDRHQALKEAIDMAMQESVRWDDSWWTSAPMSLPVAQSALVFHGSLQNADRLTALTLEGLTVFCHTPRFHCTAWYPKASHWLLHDAWTATTVRDFVEDPDRYFKDVGASDAVFVRPDSPLKPFSGRVLSRAQISMQALDYGFYYDDETLAIIVAPVREVTREWRFVIVDGIPIAGSAYLAEGRTTQASVSSGPAWEMSCDVAAALDAPERVYVLDLCESDGELKLLELNPFSGADLYACDRAAIVTAVTQVFISTRRKGPF